jgi:hypothetical protein
MLTALLDKNINKTAYDKQRNLPATMSAYTEIVCPCTTRQARYKKYRPGALTPPRSSYSPSLSLGTGVDLSAHYNHIDNLHLLQLTFRVYSCTPQRKKSPFVLI